MSSAIYFNLDQSKILSSGNGLGRAVVSEKWFLKAVGYLIQVVSNTGLTVYPLSDKWTVWIHHCARTAH